MTTTTEQRRRSWKEMLGETPPSWAVVLVKLCAVGIVALPVLLTLLLVVASALGPKGHFAQIAFIVSVALWVAMFGCAQFITSRYPPVPRVQRAQ